MRTKRPILTLHHRSALWYLLTTMLFLYVCADVSVFEYYEGNQSLGIISYREKIKLDSPSQDPGSGSFQKSAKVNVPAPHNEKTSNLLDDTDDFCCSVHAMMNGNKVVILFSPIFGKSHEANFAASVRDSEWHQHRFYRPPRFNA